MGSSYSAEPVADFDLPQQQIVSTELQGSSAQVGYSRQATAVRPPLRLPKTFLSVRDGIVTVEVMASVGGYAELLVPGSVAVHKDRLWPVIAPVSGSEPRCRTFYAAAGDSVGGGSAASTALRFDRPEERVETCQLYPSQLQDSTEATADLRTWPLVLVLRPGVFKGAFGEAALDPPDGTVFVCCDWREGQFCVQRQMLAWGGSGQAYLMKELYGLSEAEDQRMCVVCWMQPKDTALVPCGHFCVCYDCGSSIRLTPVNNRCPLCRRSVEDVVRLHLPAAEEARDSAGRGAEAEDASPAACTAAGDVPPELGAATAQPAFAAAVVGAEAPAAGVAAAAALTPAASASAAAEEQPLPRRCLLRLGQELKQMEASRAQHLSEHGVELSLADESGGDMRTFTLRLLSSGFDPKSSIGSQLSSRHIDAVELEVWIPDRFPDVPPKVRVLRPCFSTGSFYVHSYGALCLEVLTTAGWPSATTLHALGLQIKSMLIAGTGSISGTGNMAAPGAAGRAQAYAVSRRIEDAHQDWKEGR